MREYGPAGSHVLHLFHFCRYNFRLLDSLGWNFRHAYFHEAGRRTLYKVYGIKFVIIVQGRAGNLIFGSDIRYDNAILCFRQIWPKEYGYKHCGGTGAVGIHHHVLWFHSPSLRIREENCKWLLSLQHFVKIKCSLKIVYPQLIAYYICSRL